MKKRKILFVTERRADYSRLKPILRAVQDSPKLELQLVVTGAHLLKSFGETKRVIQNDGFPIDAALPVFKTTDADDGVAMSLALSEFIKKLTIAFEKLKPDLVFCGFDIGAHLAAAIAAVHLNIPVAHIQGGERSGTIDEMLRHAMTKFSHFHFVATRESRDRVIKLGEDPRYVFLVGSPSLDTIHHITYPPKAEIFARYGLNPEKPLIVFLQHPVTTEVKEVEKQIAVSIDGVRSAAQRTDAQVLAIYSNNDAGGKRIIGALQRSKFITHSHIPYEDFLRLLKHSDALVGNSSTGIHEAPSFGLPTINIGTRQNLRERGANVLDVENNKQLIEEAVYKALTDKKLKSRIKAAKNPYDRGDTAKNIVHVLETVEFPSVQKVLTY